MQITGSKPIDDLVARAVAGDGSAFTHLWDKYIDSLKNFLRSWMKNLDDFYIDDICSRSFEKAFRQIGSFDASKSQFFTWLKTIARNTALDLVDHEIRISGQLIVLEDNIGEDSDNPLDEIIRDEDRCETEKYIEGLPEIYREVARKRLVDGLQYKEIAEELDLELNTVRTRLRRAKALIEKIKD